MIHSQTLTAKELSSLSGFMILKDDGIFQPKDLFVITVRNDIPAEGETLEDKRLTRQQIFFTITAVDTPENTRGIRRGYAMVKLKRTKNPIPKEVETEEAETEEQG